MTRERFRIGVRATQFAANFMPDDRDDGLDRGAWEKKRKDPKPQPKPEPPLNGPSYPAYQQNPYSQNQQQQQYSGPQYQTQQPAYHGPNSYNTPNNPAGYGGQPPNNGGYATGQPSPPLASQNQYGNYPNQQTQNSTMDPFYGQGSYMPSQNTHSVPQGQSPFAPPQLSRAATTPSSGYAAPPAPRYCPYHGSNRDWSCDECRRLSY